MKLKLNLCLLVLSEEMKVDDHVEAKKMMVHVEQDDAGTTHGDQLRVLIAFDAVEIRRWNRGNKVHTAREQC